MMTAKQLFEGRRVSFLFTRRLLRNLFFVNLKEQKENQSYDTLYSNCLAHTIVGVALKKVKRWRAF
jgi:hypothetical protein